MAELSKQMKDGSELFLKMGRENTQGGDVFPNAIDYMAENDVVDFGNKVERMVLGYRKGGNFVELGTAWDTGTGKYIFMPNK